jgi:hypothetical protein
LAYFRSGSGVEVSDDFRGWRECRGNLLQLLVWNRGGIVFCRRAVGDQINYGAWARMSFRVGSQRVA